MSPSTALRPAVPDILEEHLEEVAFLAIRRRKLLFSPEISPRRLGFQLARIAAHRDGLRVGGEATVALVERVLSEGEDPWQITAAALTWLDLARPDAAALAARWQELPAELLPAWREALRLGDARQVPALVEGLVEREGAAGHLACDALGWHRGLAPEWAGAAAAGNDPLKRWAIARHAAGLPARVAAGVLARLIGDADAAVRAAAQWSLALTDTQAAVEHARASADPVALRVRGIFGGDADLEALAAAAAEPKRSAAACAALADHGGLAAALALADPAADGEPALAALSALLGRLPEGDAPFTAEAIRRCWLQLAPATGARLRLGQTRPWSGAAVDEPMEWLWRTAVVSVATADSAWLRREIPDGLLAGAPSEEALPGE